MKLNTSWSASIDEEIVTGNDPHVPIPTFLNLSSSKTKYSISHLIFGQLEPGVDDGR